MRYVAFCLPPRAASGSSLISVNGTSGARLWAYALTGPDGLPSVIFASPSIGLNGIIYASSVQGDYMNKNFGRIVALYATPPAGATDTDALAVFTATAGADTAGAESTAMKLELEV